MIESSPSAFSLGGPPLERGPAASLARLRAEVSDLRMRLRAQHAAGAADAVRIAVLEPERQAWEDRALAARDTAQRLARELDAERGARRRDSARLDDHRSALASARDELSTMSRRQSHLENEAATLAGRLERVAADARHEIGRLAAAVAQRDHDLAEMRRESVGAQAAASRLRDVVSSLRGELADIQAMLDGAGDRVRAGDRLTQGSGPPSSIRATAAAQIEARVQTPSLRELLSDLGAGSSRPVTHEELRQRGAEQSQAAAEVRAPADQATRMAKRLDAAAAMLRASAHVEPDDRLLRHPLRAPTSTSAAAVTLGTPTETSVAVARRPGAAPIAHGRPALAATVGRRADLREVLVRLARRDPFSAARVIAGLLPAQGAFLDADLSYDLTIRELGTFAVTVAAGDTSVSLVARPRPRRHAELHLSAGALTLAELLSGRHRRVGRFLSPVRVKGARARLAVLGALAEIRPTLAEVLRAGARLEPGLVMRLMPHAIEPAWTRGHRFTVVQEISDPTPYRWYVEVGDGAGVRVTSLHTGRRPDAIVSLSASAFGRMLREDPVDPRDRPWIRGDFEAVETLRRWLERARS